MTRLLLQVLAVMASLALWNAAFAPGVLAANFTVEPWKDPKDKGDLGDAAPAPKYPTIAAACGDSIYFQWNSKKKPHGVFLLSDPSGTCPPNFKDPSAGREVAPPVTRSNFTYIVPPTSPPRIWLVCPVADHCAQGQKVEVLVTCPAAAG